MDSAASPPIGLGLASVVVLVLANAFFVAAEFALVGARRTRLDEMASAGDGKARLARRAVQSLDRYISATQLGITLASLGLGWIGEPSLAGLITGGFGWLPASLAAVATHGVASAIAFIFITILHIILGELVPKALALIHPEEVSRWVAAPLIGFGWLMAWPIALLNGTANRLLRVIGISPPGEHERLHSPEEIRMLVEQSTEGGSLLKEDARLLEGVFEFSEKTAQEVMTPRTQMVALEGGLSVQAAADEVAQARRSRYPVYTESLDEIVGVVHAKDILTALRARPQDTVQAIMRPPLFVPGTREVEDVLADMKRLKTHLAVVLDEYGGTAGLVTMEDLLEEIVGPIFDEYDPQDRAVAGDGATRLDGAMPITEFNTKFDAALDDTDYTTLGGYVFGQLGRLPRPGDRVTVAPHTFEVVDMEGRRVRTLRLHTTSPAEVEQAGGPAGA
ncbi:MAG TPA: hemolysin family protein [Gemmatimonadales bacterium]|jgi:CBS domain containing-hemolysin-like protein|nr:hemolysin family protein [Gemmatimonadales bacterium]